MVSTSENFGLRVPCKICELEDDTTSHVLSCIFLKLEVPEITDFNEIKVNDVFTEDVIKMNIFVEAFLKVWRKREEILYNMSRTAEPTST